MDKIGNGKKYYENVDALRGFAITLMVLGHAIAKENILTDSVVACNYLFKVIYSFHMPLFFIISGFCFLHPSSYIKYVKHKCRYLLVPYVSFNLITVILQRTITFFTLGTKSLTEDLNSILFHGGSLWFVYVMFMIVIAFPIISRIINHRMEIALGITVILIIICKFVKLPSIFCLNQVVNYTVFFLIGHCLRILDERLQIFEMLKNKMMNIGLCIILFAFNFGLVYSIQFLNNRQPNYFEHVVLAISGSVASYLLIKSFKNGFLKVQLIGLGKYSLQIYLFNGYFISVSRTLLTKILGMENVFVLAVCNMLFGLILNYLCCLCILRMKAVKFVCGKR